MELASKEREMTLVEFAAEEVRNLNPRPYTSWHSRQEARTKDKLMEHLSRLITRATARMAYEDEVYEFLLERIRCHFDDLKEYTRFSIERGVNYITLEDNQFEFADTRECVLEYQQSLLSLCDTVKFEQFIHQINDELELYDTI